MNAEKVINIEGRERAKENKIEKNSLGDIIRLLRKRKKIKLVDFAKKLKVTYVHLLNVEKNKKLPSPGLLRKISKALADNKEEERLLYKKLLQYLIEKKFPTSKALKETFKKPLEFEHSKMPDVFLEILAQDYERNKDKAALFDVSELIEQALLGEIYLSYEEVRHIAKIFNLNEDIYLLLAGYIPSSDREIFKTQETVENFLKLFDFLKKHCDIDKILQAFINIVQTFSSPDKDKENL